MKEVKTMHKNRTAKGIELERKTDERYKKMLIGKKTRSGKIIVDVLWIGNSTYGVVKLVFDDHTTDLCGSPKPFKPRKIDFHSRYGIDFKQ